MKYKTLASLSLLLLLSGCETLQQRQQSTARQQAATRHADERLRRLQGQVESVEMEKARHAQAMHHHRSEVRSDNARMSQVDASLKSLGAQQSRESQEVVRRVEGLLKKSAAPRSSTPRRGAGREHIVESGHTLSAIASAYGTSVKAIKQANNLKSDTIRIGQKLFIPE